LVEIRQSQRALPEAFQSFLLAYLDLRNASWEARDRNLPPRKNPVSLEHFHNQGVGKDVLLWMFYHGHIECLDSAPGRTNGSAGLPPEEGALPTAASNFSLTEVGEAFADLFLAQALLPASEEEFEETWELLQMGRLVPGYDQDSRLFFWGCHVLKHFRQPSCNQVLVLCTAEELDWPAWFDDPLPPVPLSNPKVRLHDTVKDLNRRQEPYLIHFKGDGTGTRIGWELR
jgi:hypothetical protein